MHLHWIALLYYYSLDGSSVIKTTCQWRFVLRVLSSCYYMCY